MNLCGRDSDHETLFLQSTSDILRLVLFPLQEPAVHIVAPLQMENYRVPCDRPLSGLGGSILLCSTGKWFSIENV